MKEHLRKLMVSIKRSPQNIAGVALLVAFVYYSFNLTKISDTTAKVQGQNMGLCGFVTMLFSILIFVCFLNSFPKRKKPNIFMIILMYVMLGSMSYADILYKKGISSAVSKFENAEEVLNSNPYIMQAYNVVSVHVILLIIVAVLIALLPVYSKLLRKINTSINLEYSGTMDAIDVEE